MFCVECGQRNEDSARYCIECGQPVQASARGVRASDHVSTGTPQAEATHRPRDSGPTPDTSQGTSLPSAAPVGHGAQGRRLVGSRFLRQLLMFPVVTAVVILLYGVFYLVGSVLASLMGATESRANWIGVVVAWIAMIVVEQADAERRKGKGLARWLVIPIFFLVLIYAWKRAGQLRWVHGLSPAQLDVRRPRRGGLDAFVGATVFGAGATPSSTTGTANGQGRAEMDWDPVCGRPVDRAAGEDSVHYQGKTYYFCTAGCRRAFETDPAEYLDPSRRPST